MPFAATKNRVMNAGSATRDCSGALTFEQLHEAGPVARTVKLTKINALPAAEHELAVFDEDGLRCAGHNRLQVGGRVAFHMAIFGMVPWKYFVEPHQHVVLNVRVGVFIYSDACRRMR